MITFLASILVFGVLIFFHEMGHFAVAKAVGIKVHEFSLGFGPKLTGVTRDGTNYNLRLLPLGGFVRMAGMDPTEKDIEPGKSFEDKTVAQRMGVIAAGSIMNFVLAILLLAFIFMFQGLPVPGTTIAETIKGDPADLAGLQTGDVIQSIAGEPMQSWDQITAAINSHPGQEIEMTVLRNGQTHSFMVTPKAREDGQGMIGIMPDQILQKQGPVAALAQGAEFTFKVSVLILNFVGKMIVGQAQADLGGPVRVVWEIGKAAQTGVFYVLQLAAFLSINLGLFNLFPIPALDGSRLMFLGLEALRGRKVDPVKENFIHFMGFGFLMLLIVFITYNDIIQLFIQNPAGP